MIYIKVPLKNVFNVERIISIFEMSVDRDFKFYGESHDFRELRYIAEGEMLLNYGGKLRRMKEGDICFHESGEYHDLYCDGVHSAKFVIISFECHSAAMNYFKQRIINVPKELRPRVSEMLRLKDKCFCPSHVFGALSINKNAPFGTEQLLRRELEGFFIRLIQSDEQSVTETFFSTRDEILDKLTSDIKEQLEKHLYSRLSLDELADILHFGKSHICHVFKSRTDTGIVQYFLKLKLNEARRLLEQTERTVNDISGALCFDSSQYFARLFKREFGQTPTEFRRKAREKNA